MGSIIGPAWSWRWQAPELALVFGERALRAAHQRGDQLASLWAQTLVVSASCRLGQQLAVVDKAIEALRLAEQLTDNDAGAVLRVELAGCARSAGVPLVGAGLLRPVLSASDGRPAARAAALIQLAGCLAYSERHRELDGALAEADQLYADDRELDQDTGIGLRAVLRSFVAREHRRRGDLRAALHAAEEGADLLDGLGDLASDGGAGARISLQQVLGLLDLGWIDQACSVAAGALDGPVRAHSAAATGWLALAISTRVQLPAGLVAPAIALLREVTSIAERHRRDALHAESLTALSEAHEQAGELAETLDQLRSAQVIRARRSRALRATRSALLNAFGEARHPEDLLRLFTPAPAAARRRAAADRDQGVSGLLSPTGLWRKVDAVADPGQPGGGITLVLIDVTRTRPSVSATGRGSGGAFGAGPLGTGSLSIGSDPITEGVILKVAEHLRDLTPTEAALARVGGAELAVLLPGTSRGQVERWAEELRAAMADVDWTQVTPGLAVNVRTVAAEGRTGTAGEEDPASDRRSARTGSNPPAAGIAVDAAPPRPRRGTEVSSSRLRIPPRFSGAEPELPGERGGAFLADKHVPPARMPAESEDGGRHEPAGRDPERPREAVVPPELDTPRAQAAQAPAAQMSAVQAPVAQTPVTQAQAIQPQAVQPQASREPEKPTGYRYEPLVPTMETLESVSPQPWPAEVAEPESDRRASRRREETGAEGRSREIQPPDLSAPQSPRQDGWPTEPPRQADGSRQGESLPRAESLRQADASRQADPLRQPDSLHQPDPLRQAEPEGAWRWSASETESPELPSPSAASRPAEKPQPWYQSTARDAESVQRWRRIAAPETAASETTASQTAASKTVTPETAALGTTEPAPAESQTAEPQTGTPPIARRHTPSPSPSPADQSPAAPAATAAPPPTAENRLPDAFPGSLPRVETRSATPAADTADTATSRAGRRSADAARTGAADLGADLEPTQRWAPVWVPADAESSTGRWLLSSATSTPTTEPPATSSSAADSASPAVEASATPEASASVESPASVEASAAESPAVDERSGGRRFTESAGEVDRFGLSLGFGGTGRRSSGPGSGRFRLGGFESAARPTGESGPGPAGQVSAGQVPVGQSSVGQASVSGDEASTTEPSGSGRRRAPEDRAAAAPPARRAPEPPRESAATNAATNTTTSTIADAATGTSAGATSSATQGTIAGYRDPTPPTRPAQPAAPEPAAPEPTASEPTAPRGGRRRKEDLDPEPAHTQPVSPPLAASAGGTTGALATGSRHADQPVEPTRSVLDSLGIAAGSGGRRRAPDAGGSSAAPPRTPRRRARDDDEDLPPTFSQLLASTDSESTGRRARRDYSQPTAGQPTVSQPAVGGGSATTERPTESVTGETSRRAAAEAAIAAELISPTSVSAPPVTPAPSTPTRSTPTEPMPAAGPAETAVREADAPRESDAPGAGALGTGALGEDALGVDALAGTGPGADLTAAGAETGSSFSALSEFSAMLARFDDQPQPAGSKPESTPQPSTPQPSTPQSATSVSTPSHPSTSHPSTQSAPPPPTAPTPTAPTPTAPTPAVPGLAAFFGSSHGASPGPSHGAAIEQPEPTTTPLRPPAVPPSPAPVPPPAPSHYAPVERSVAQQPFAPETMFGPGVAAPETANRETANRDSPAPSPQPPTQPQPSTRSQPAAAPPPPAKEPTQAPTPPPLLRPTPPPSRIAAKLSAPPDSGSDSDVAHLDGRTARSGDRRRPRSTNKLGDLLTEALRAYQDVRDSDAGQEGLASSSEPSELGATELGDWLGTGTDPIGSAEPPSWRPGSSSRSFGVSRHSSDESGDSWRQGPDWHPPAN
ncbi:MAG TPA: hypothetical protein VHX38_38575 [Pseudonocardiaceae bacterium]|nr:hypothetical protein [Pseudonocardiaceae bacterium]